MGVLEAVARGATAVRSAVEGALEDRNCRLEGGDRGLEIAPEEACGEFERWLRERGRRGRRAGGSL